MAQSPEPRQDPTAARNAYLARVRANPPASRQPCAANCGQPLTQWHVDAQGRHWHPDCLPAGTPMPVTAEERIRRLEAQLAEADAEQERLTTAVTNVRYVVEVIEANGIGWAAHSIRRALDGTLGAAVTRVTDHTFEGIPGPGSRCETERFGQICGAAWEQHEMREDPTS